MALMPSPKMAVYLHADGGPPDYLTEDLGTIAEVARVFGWHDSQLVMANDLADHLKSPVTASLAAAEEASMVCVVIKGPLPAVARPNATAHRKSPDKLVASQLHSGSSAEGWLASHPSFSVPLRMNNLRNNDS